MSYIQTPEELLRRLSAQNGGSIVCSGSCNVLEIACAQADRSGRFYVDERGIGYVLRPETEKTAKQIRAEARAKALEEAMHRVDIGCGNNPTKSGVLATIRALMGQPAAPPEEAKG